MKIGLLTLIKNKYKYICKLKTKCIFAIPKRNKNMRTIKFRGLRTDGKGWVYGYYLKQNGRGVDGSKDVDIYFILDDSGTQIIIPETVGQFTGLTDKNGVEIYEGDDLQDLDGDIILRNVSISEVVLGKDDYGISYKTICVNAQYNDLSGHVALILDDDGSYGAPAKECVIIGNIHQK